MKRLLSFALALIMLTSVFFSCGKDNNPENNSSTLTTANNNAVNPDDSLIDGAVYRIVTPTLDRIEYAIKGNEFCSRNNMECTVSSYKGVLSSLWRVRFTGEDNSIVIESVATCERYLTVPQDSEYGTPITVSSPLNPSQPGQKFFAVKDENGYYTLKNTDSLSVIGLSSPSAGATVISAEEDGSLSQSWKFIKTADPDKQIPTLLPVSGDVIHSSTPEIIRDGDTYYMYIMTGRVSIKKSDDLRVWKGVGSAFDKADKSFPLK